MNFTIPIHQRREKNGTLHWTTLGLGAHTRTKSGGHAPKVRQALIDELRAIVRKLDAPELAAFAFKRGTRLELVRLEIARKSRQGSRKGAGRCGLIVEPRLLEGGRFVIGYHPARQAEWFPIDEGGDGLAEVASRYFGHAWSALDDDDVDALWSDGRESLDLIAFSAEVPSLLDRLPTRRKGVWDDLAADPLAGQKPKAQEEKTGLLARLGVDLTERVASEEGERSLGLPRSPYREELASLLAVPRPQPVIVVGAPGSGKSTLLRRAIADQLAAADFATHRNLDRVHHVWEISAKRIIAGMSYVGDWEQRCVDLLDEVRSKKVVLFATDLFHFGKVGRARTSERCLADFFRGPVARGEIVLAGECTPEQLRLLEEDAPSFASLFARVHVQPATPEETLRMIRHEARALERAGAGNFSPWSYRTILELGGALAPARAFPGKVLDMVRRIAAFHGANEEIDSEEVVQYLSSVTGVPWGILSDEENITRGEIESDLSERVIGQPEAVSAVADLALTIKAGLTDPRRPYGVYLFTGPTGTGKTELAKALAASLYGSESSLVRFDMSEFSSWDAPARLVGDALEPEGLLVRAALEQPFSVILLDEIEKAHPSVLNLLLQLFDEGRLTDASGTTASFVHSVLVMTSNLGARARPAPGFGASENEVLATVAKAVKEFFPPELFNRIDRIVPFRPLAMETAVLVAQKELDKLLSRRGLTDRDILVRTSRPVVERVAREAFRKADGARSLKRFLEDTVGSILSAEIAKNPDAVLQIFRISDSPEGLRVDHERLVEAAPLAVKYALEPLLDLSALVLRQHLPALLPLLDAIESRGDLEAIAEKIRFYLGEHNLGRREHGAALYNLEWLRMQIASFRERIERLVVASRNFAYEALEAEHTEGTIIDKETGQERRVRLLDRLGDTGTGAVATKQELLGCLAQAQFFKRAIAKVADPEEHAVFVELVPIGPAPALMLAAARGYAHGYAGLDALAYVANGRIVEPPATVENVDRVSAAEYMVMRKVGLNVRDSYMYEEGTHVWRRRGYAPELVRVRVLGLGGKTARQLAEKFLSDKAAYDRTGQGENPAALLPLVRRVVSEVPGKKPASFDVEDFRTGYAGTVWAKSYAGALIPRSLLEMSRIEEAER